DQTLKPRFALGCQGFPGPPLPEGWPYEGWPGKARSDRLDPFPTLRCPMFPGGWRMWTSRKRAQWAGRPGGAARRKSPYRPRLEAGEDRQAPASHIWQGPAAGGLWSNAANWNGGVPTSNEPGGTLLFFNNGIDSTGDIANLVVDAIQYTGGVTINVPTGTTLD